LGALVLPILLLTLSGVSADTVWSRIARGDGCGSRLLLWSNVLHLIFERPWTGWGWGELDFAHYMTLYPGRRFCDILDNAHDLPLHLAVELGIPAMLAICIAFIWALLRARPWRETDPSRQLAWSIVAVILLHNLLEYPLWYGPFQIAFGLCLGLLWRRPPAPNFNRSSGAAAMQRSVAALLVMMLGYGAWDYYRVSQIYAAFESRAPAYRDDTVNKIRSSWLFGSQAKFAELTITPLTRENAQWTYDTAQAMLHFSPEPRVIEKVIESAVMLGRDDQALAHLARYRAAFPSEHAKWTAANACPMPIGPAAQNCKSVKD
jgi:hypothetical protein